MPLLAHLLACRRFASRQVASWSHHGYHGYFRLPRGHVHVLVRPQGSACEYNVKVLVLLLLQLVVLKVGTLVIPCKRTRHTTRHLGLLVPETIRQNGQVHIHTVSSMHKLITKNEFGSNIGNVMVIVKVPRKYVTIRAKHRRFLLPPCPNFVVTVESTTKQRAGYLDTDALKLCRKWFTWRFHSMPMALRSPIPTLTPLRLP